MTKKVVLSFVVLNEESLIKISKTFEDLGYTIVCVITHYDWLPLVKKVLPNVETHWLDNFMHPGKWDFPFFEEAYKVVCSESVTMSLALTERYEGNYGILESETRLMFQASLAQDIINRHKPDFFVSWYAVERALDYAMFMLCKHHSIPVLMTKSAGFKRLISCTTEIDGPVIHKSGEASSSTISLNNLQNSEEIYPFVKDVLQKLRSKNGNLFQQNEIRRGFKEAGSPSFSRTKFFLQSVKTKGIKDTFRWLTIHGFLTNDLFYKRFLFHRYQEIARPIEKKPGFKYLYFPLHVQPELTSMPIGGDFVNQLRAIKMLSDAVDERTIILVKEHPSTFSSNARINRRFKNELNYKWFASIPKVQLISIDLDVNELLDLSFAVATINGNIASEALLANKPALVFSSNFLNGAPGIYFVKDVNAIKGALHEISSLNLNTTEVDKFIKQLCKHTSCIAPQNFEEVVFNDVIIPEITDVLLKGFIKYNNALNGKFS